MSISRKRKSTIPRTPAPPEYREARLKAGISLEALGREIGISSSAVVMWENGAFRRHAIKPGSGERYLAGIERILARRAAELRDLQIKTGKAHVVAGERLVAEAGVR